MEEKEIIAKLIEITGGEFKVRNGKKIVLSFGKPKEYTGEDVKKLGKVCAKLEKAGILVIKTGSIDIGFELEIDTSRVDFADRLNDAANGRAEPLKEPFQKLAPVVDNSYMGERLSSSSNGDQVLALLKKISNHPAEIVKMNDGRYSLGIVDKKNGKITDNETANILKQAGIVVEIDVVGNSDMPVNLVDAKQEDLQQKLEKIAKRILKLTEGEIDRIGHMMVELDKEAQIDPELHVVIRDDPDSTPSQFDRSTYHMRRRYLEQMYISTINPYGEIISSLLNEATGSEFQYNHHGSFSTRVVGEVSAMSAALEKAGIYNWIGGRDEKEDTGNIHINLLQENFFANLVEMVVQKRLSQPGNHDAAQIRESLVGELQAVEKSTQDEITKLIKEAWDVPYVTREIHDRGRPEHNLCYHLNLPSDFPVIIPGIDKEFPKKLSAAVAAKRGGGEHLQAQLERDIDKHLADARALACGQLGAVR